jgi:hypothetical protein
MWWVSAGLCGVIKVFVPISVVALGIVSACGGSSTSRSGCAFGDGCGGHVVGGPGGGAGVSGGVGVGGAIGAGGGIAGSSGTAGDGAGGSFDSGTRDGGASSDGCAVASDEFAPAQLDLFVMLDVSESMRLNADRWGRVSSAIEAFVQSPDAEGLGVGIGYFGSSCNPNDYARPDVPIGVVPAIAPAILDSLDRQTPGSGRPTLPALQGALMYASQSVGTQTGHRPLIVLITDGAPQGCNGDIAAVSRAAALGTVAIPQVLTHVLDVGDVGMFDPVARAGGTEKARVAQTTEQIVDVLKEISGRKALCEFVLPATGRPGIDAGKLNVFVQPVRGTESLVVRVEGPESCDADSGGWYLDHGDGGQTSIVFCPATCSRVTGTTRIRITLGCPDPPPP